MQKVKTFIKANYKLVSVTMSASLAGVLIGGTLISQAAIPASDGTIHGCRNNTTTLLRVIDNASQSCDSNESSLNWDQKGVKAYTRITYSGGTYNLDSNRSYNISNFQSVSAAPPLGAQLLCIAIPGEPKNVSITHLTSPQISIMTLGIKDSNGWTSSYGTTCDQQGAGANVLLHVVGASADGFFLTIH